MIDKKFKIAKYNIHNIPESVKYHTCPICSKDRKKSTQKCLTVFWDSGMAKCSHCGRNIQLHEWEKKNKNTDYKIPEWNNNTNLSDKVVKWFESRKISQFILRLMGISEGIENMPDKNGWKEKNTIQFPYFRLGDIVDIKYRSGDKTFKLYKGAERIGYNIDNAIGKNEIYFVEGEMDVLAVMECGIHNVVSPPNGFTKQGNVNIDWINNDIDLFDNAEKFILCFDNDVPGENGKREFIRRFGAHKCFVVDLEGEKDANDYLVKYGSEKLRKKLENHIEIPLENVSIYDDYKDRVRDFFLNGMPRGYTTGTMKEYDKNISVNTGQILLVTGIPSHGKSEIVDQIVISLSINYGLSAAYCSVENKPNELHHQKILRKINGRTPNSVNDFNQSFIECEKYVNNHFYMIDMDSYDLDRVLLKAEELVYRKGIKILAIDPFNKIKLKGDIEPISGNRTNDYTNAYLEKLNNFAVKFDVLVILVAHPVKMGKSENGKRNIPDFYDVKGGGEFYDMCHHGIVVHRDFMLGLTLIRTLKVKFQHLGESNKDAWYKYDVDSGRLIDINGDPESAEGYEILWDKKNWITKKTNISEQVMFSDQFIEPIKGFYEDTDEPPF